MNAYDFYACSEAAKCSKVQGLKLVNDQYHVTTPSTTEINTHEGEHSEQFANPFKCNLNTSKTFSEECSELRSRMADIRKRLLGWRVEDGRKMEEAKSPVQSTSKTSLQSHPKPTNQNSPMQSACQTDFSLQTFWDWVESSSLVAQSPSVLQSHPKPINQNSPMQSACQTGFGLQTFWDWVESSSLDSQSPSSSSNQTSLIQSQTNFEQETSSLPQSLVEQLPSAGYEMECFTTLPSSENKDALSEKLHTGRPIWQTSPGIASRNAGMN